MNFCLSNKLKNTFLQIYLKKELDMFFDSTMNLLSSIFIIIRNQILLI